MNYILARRTIRVCQDVFCNLGRMILQGQGKREYIVVHAMLLKRLGNVYNLHKLNAGGEGTKFES